MECSKCGFENESDALFCEKCGNKLTQNSVGIMVILIIAFCICIFPFIITILLISCGLL